MTLEFISHPNEAVLSYIMEADLKTVNQSGG